MHNDSHGEIRMQQTKFKFKNNRTRLRVFIDFSGRNDNDGFFWRFKYNREPNP